jgi:hypothetical protein
MGSTLVKVNPRVGLTADGHRGAFFATLHINVAAARDRAVFGQRACDRLDQIGEETGRGASAKPFAVSSWHGLEVGPGSPACQELWGLRIGRVPLFSPRLGPV